MASPRLPDVVFDFDGVLANSAPLIVEVLERAVVLEVGITITQDRLLAAVGPPFREAVHHLLTEADSDVSARSVDAVVRRFRADYWERAPSETEPFHGIRQAVSEISKSARVTICSSKPYPLVSAILERWPDGFAFSDVEAPHPDRTESKDQGLLRLMARNGMDPANTVMVGDTVFDVRAAHAVGSRCIGAGWGVGDTASLLAEGALAVAPTPLDLSGIVTRTVS